jgi:hypothetical protein
MNHEIHVRGMAAWEVAKAFEKALASAWDGKTITQFRTDVSGFQDLLELNLDASLLSENEAWIERLELLRTDSFFHDIKTVHFRLLHGWALIYFADQGGWPLVRLDVPDQSRDEARERDFLRALNLNLPVIPKAERGKVALSETQLEGLKFAKEVISSFATEAARMSQDTAKHFNEFVEAVKERTLQLEDQFQTKSTELDALFQQKQSALEEEHKSKLKDLEEREKAHAEAEKQFELRNNTAVRRDLLREIRAKIEAQKTIEISEGTTKKRTVILVTCVATLILSAVIIGVFVWKLTQATSVDWHLLIPLTAWTTIFVSTGIYFLKWNDQWFRDHAKVEFETRKFSADILRASWVAELLFEWAEKKGINLPPELINSFTKNLFESPDSNTKLHPSDQLADLLKQVSSLEMGKNGMKLTRSEPKTP